MNSTKHGVRHSFPGNLFMNGHARGRIVSSRGRRGISPSSPIRSTDSGMRLGRNTPSSKAS